MKNSEMLKKVMDMMIEDGELDNEARLVDWLDCLACLGLESASDAYIHLLESNAFNKDKKRVTV